MSCGNNHSIAWDDNGKVYAWGDAALGKLGKPYQGEKKIKPEQYPM